MNKNIFMSIFVAIGAILMVLFYFLRALVLFLPVIVVIALIGMLIYSIKKNRNNDNK